MSETKWTPGPWLWTGGSAYLIRSKRGGNVCSVLVSDTTAKAQANAHLIAAAPELYEALDVLSHVATPETLMHARAVLAKARGETS